VSKRLIKKPEQPRILTDQERRDRLSRLLAFGLPAVPRAEYEARNEDLITTR
jgi:hypothetical protein